MNKPSDPRATYISIASRKFANDGFHGVSLAELAKEAGVTKQALLHFFGTKERLYAEVLFDLAERLCADIEAATQPNPTDHLAGYLASFAGVTLVNQDDARLVVRALLDSDPKAKTWPMKIFIDRIVEVAMSTPGGSRCSMDEVRAWVFQIIASVQYLAISSTAITGMYGKNTTAALGTHFEETIKAAVEEFVKDGA